MDEIDSATQAPPLWSLSLDPDQLPNVFDRSRPTIGRVLT